jgi:hypothetical protein
VVMAANRRDLTLACLRSLRGQRVPGVALNVFVLDDPSDGTSEAIADQFPEVTRVARCRPAVRERGMRHAFAASSRATTTCARIHSGTHQGDRPDPRVNQGPERRRTRGEKVIQSSLPSRNHHRRP